MVMVPLAYRIAARLAHRVPVPTGKLAESIVGRKAAATRWCEWASRERTNRPLVWVHGASVGEGLTAEPVVRRLRVAIRQLQVVHTYSSPSAAAWPARFAADRADFVPLDESHQVNRVLRALRPSLLVFSRGDLWPDLVAQARIAGTPVTVVGATVRPSSKRLRWPARSILRSLHRNLNWIGAASQADADRWISLGASRDTVMVTGDPRHDQIAERIPQLKRVKALGDWSRHRVVLVAGSVHRRDCRVLLTAFARLWRSHPSAGLVLVPHEPTERNLATLVAQAERCGVEISLWRGKALQQDASCIIAAQLGVLADVYTHADMAYVGGGFKSGQLHATIEPACYALPVIVGPEHESSADAQRLLQQGGAVALPQTAPAEGLTAQWQEWLESPTRRIETGLRARRTIQQGAASLTAQALIEIMSGSGT